MLIRLSDPQYGELDFDVEIAGQDDGDPVFLLHGFPQTSYSWHRLTPGLVDAGFRVVAPNQRGYSPGARPATADAYGTHHLVTDVLGIADVLGCARFHLVGHDWGGAIAWQVAGRFPERVKSLTVFSTPHPAAFGAALSGELGGDQPERSGYIEMLRSDGIEEAMFADDAALFRAVFSGSGLNDHEAAPYMAALGSPEVLAGPLNWYRAGDLTLVDGLGVIVAPTLYVWSTDDIALGREAAEDTANHVEGQYRFEVLDGIDHWIPEHGADLVQDLLLAHLKENR